MALQPRKQKYRKAFRGKMRGKASRGNQLNFGEYGLKATGRGWLTAQQIEAARRSITHHTKRQAKVWIRVFSDKPVTAKPAGAGMGGGKGSVDKYVVVVKPGRILFEVSGVDRKVAKEAIRLASHKLPFKSKFVSKE
jgi:large subunit ribosomal protein L16